MGVREGLLALLAAGPRHGYALKLGFEAATGREWSLNVGQVYGALHKLEASGLVAFDGEQDGRKRYRLTPSGHDEVRRWLVDDPVGHDLTERDELAMKVLLADATAVVGAREVIAAQRDATMSVLQTLTRQRGELAADEIIRMVHLDRLILHGRAELDWLERTEVRLEAAARARTAASDGATDGGLMAAGEVRR